MVFVSGVCGVSERIVSLGFGLGGAGTYRAHPVFAGGAVGSFGSFPGSDRVGNFWWLVWSTSIGFLLRWGVGFGFGFGSS